MSEQARYVGIEIGGTKLQIVSGSTGGKIIQRWRFEVEVEQGGAGIRRILEQKLPAICREIPALEALGVGFGGPVDWQQGSIACSHQIAGWSGFQLAPWLESLVSRPVVVDNDANTAALGEALAGAGRNFNPVFYVTMGSGVGGGLAVNGRIYHGAKPGESELGHVRLDRSGAIVESRCSGWAVDAKIRRLNASHPECLLARLCGAASRGEARFLAQACAAGDEFAWQILNETAEDLAFALAHVIHLLHPEIIILGGGLSLVGETLRAAVASRITPFIMEIFHPSPKIVLAGLGEDAVPVGALLLAGQK